MVMEGLPTKSHPKWDWVDNCGTPCTQPVIEKKGKQTPLSNIDPVQNKIH